ncbi:MAG: hypothetical protein KBF96_08910 [Ignavibacteria bacterium]|nr:hypothetical protein [Ignavibacteria bacterium]
MNKFRIFISFLVFTFLLVAIFGNIALLTLEEYWPDYDYYSDNLIEIVYILSIVLDLILIFLIVKYIYFDMMKKESEHIEKKILLVNLILISLIWYEAIYKTFWYYWGFQSNQGGLIDVNNIGIIGSFMLSIYSIFMIKFDKNNSLFKTITIYISTIMFIFVSHLIVYSLLTPR